MRPRLRPGDLRHSVVIQVKSTTQDSFGGMPDTWTDVITVRAKISPMKGREYMNARVANSETTHRVKMRYYSGLTAKHRLLFGSRYLYPESIVNVDELNVVHELMCTEKDV